MSLAYPFDAGLLVRRRRAILADLRGRPTTREARVAVLGGSTTSDVVDFLEMFLRADGIRPTFHVSAFGRFFEEAVFDDGTLRDFAPDFVLVHTTSRNLRELPAMLADRAAVDRLLDDELERFGRIWTSLLASTNAVVLQNTFDPLPHEPLGHLGLTAEYGHSRFVARLNAAFVERARDTPRLRLVDLARLAADVGLRHWTSARHWIRHRMALSADGSAAVAHAVARAIRAAVGRSRKCLVLDLDNTLWGGVVGDDGVAQLSMGYGSPEGEAFCAFQAYCRALKERGVLLAVCSKNEDAVARAAFEHPDCVLRLSDFSAFVASWEPKPEGLQRIARELGIGLDALVFVDDNPAERALVALELPEVAVPEVDDVTTFTEVLDAAGYFEPFTVGADDAARVARYADEAARTATALRFDDYGAYLDSLEMTTTIRGFANEDLDRIAQLVNKTNQFNLTTRRCTLGDVALFATAPGYLSLAARLRDRFGDTGLVSALVGKVEGDELEIILWVMSCRVLKRDLELALFDALVERARARGVRVLVGRYLPTERNALVAEHYPRLGFASTAEPGVYRLDLAHVTTPKNRHLRRISDEDDHDSNASAVP